MPLRLAVLASIRDEARAEANTGRLSPFPRYWGKFLEMLVRHGEEEGAQVKEEYRQASAAWSGALQAAGEAIATEEHTLRQGGALTRTEEESGAPRGG